MSRKIINTIIGISVAVLFLVLSLRHKPLNEIFKSLLSTNVFYVIPAFIFYILTFLARSEKWKLQLQSLGFTICSKKAFDSISIHYFANSFSIKLGAVVRCTNLKKNSKIPISSCIGLFFSENVFDFLFLFIAVLLTLLFNFKAIWAILSLFFVDLYKHLEHNQLLIIIVFSLIIIATVVLYYLYGSMLLEKHKVKFQNFWHAIKNTFRIKRFGLFLIWQVVLWLLLLGMNFFLFKSLFNQNLSMVSLLTITSFLYAAWLIPSPAGIGSVQYFMLQAFSIYGFSATNALSFGFLSNFLTLITAILIGLAVIIKQNFKKNYSLSIDN